MTPRHCRPVLLALTLALALLPLTSLAASTPPTPGRPPAIAPHLGTEPNADLASATSSAALPAVWYFAEGYTGPGFDEYLTILNPNTTPADVAITYFLRAGNPIVKNITVSAASRRTVTVHDTSEGVGRDQEVAAKVTTTNAGGIVVERPMYFTYGANVTGGHNVMGANAPRASWYFAEGYTGSGFDEYLTILNPNATSADITITYYLSTGATQTTALQVNANSRRTVVVHETSEGVGRGQEVAAHVTTTHGGGIVVERPMYFTYNGTITGGHNVMGAPAPGTTWLFAEGYTGTGFDEYLTILNPNATSADITITYYLSTGSAVTKHLSVDGNARQTVVVHETSEGVGRGQEVAARVTTTNAGGIVVERPMYFTYNGAVTGGHNVMGTPLPQADWLFAEGYTGQGFDEYLTLLNTNTTAAPVTITYYLTDGTTQATTLTINPTARQTVAVHDATNGVGRGKAVSARVTTTNAGGIVAERPMYFTYNGTVTGSHNVMGYPAGSGGAPSPTDPATLAPALDASVAMGFAAATNFLYTGPNAIQTGVGPNAIDPARVAVIRGRVTQRDGQPLSGAVVRVLGHPEFGQTVSRADGRYDLAVNGGGLVTLDIQRGGFLPAQRAVTTAWLAYAHAPDAALITVDPLVTTVNLAGSTAIQVARGSVQSDADGARQATLLVPPGVQASMTLPGGTTQPLNTLSIRATEYTVGTGGVRAMPGQLPPTSAYTYAVELSVDEAMVAGATTVSFDRPVPFYVENFLNFPTGMVVPAGYYDRQQGQWVAGPNGRVIKILNITGALANLDVTGDGVADTGAALTTLGIDDAERAKLATLYAAGQSLWRVPITHFTPWDCNWPGGPPTGAGAANQETPGAATCGGKKRKGSIIECHTQVLLEQVDISGTSSALVYRSDHAPGYQEAYTATIPLSSATVPPGLKAIDLELAVAGQLVTRTFSPAPNQRTSFTWDGRDAYGRAVQGAQVLTVRIGYRYDAVYYAPAQFEQAFGNFSGVPITANSAREEVTLWQEWQRMVGGWDARGVGLGGWRLSSHHAYDPTGKVLSFGDGSRRDAAALTTGVITTVAGGGLVPGPGIGDGGPATQAEVAQSWGLSVGPDGGYYVAEFGGHRIRRVGADGVITTVAGTGVAGYNGDGIPATQAQLNGSADAVAGPDGSVYIADTFNQRIRKVAPNGVITTIAGTGVAGYNGDGIPAAQAKLNDPYGLAVGADGSVYIADRSNTRVRRVGPNGVITTVAGSGQSGSSGDGGPAAQAKFGLVWDVALGPDGSLYIGDRSNARIRKVGPDGIIITVAGNGQFGFSGDGGPATQAKISSPYQIAVGPDGSLVIPDDPNNRVRVVGPDGIITTVAGKTQTGFGGDGGPATQALISAPTGVAVAVDGALLFTDRANARVRRVGSAFPAAAAGDILIPSADGGEVYLFTGAGRHQRTLHGLTGETLVEFGYDAQFRLATVTEKTGGVDNTATIERNASGRPTAIVGPFGHRTTLTTDANGYLTGIANPLGHTTVLAHAANGLLSQMTDPRGGIHRYTYDALGRLTRDENPTSAAQTLSRSDTAGGYTVAFTTALGRTATYQVQQTPANGWRFVATEPSGAQTVTELAGDGSVRTTLPDGTIETVTAGPDPRWGMLAPVATNTTTVLPSGLTRIITGSRTATLANPANPFSLQTLTETVAVNGRSTTSVYTAATRTHLTTSPAGRTLTTTIDTLGRVTRQQVSGIEAITAAYDSRGRPTSLTQGTGGSARATIFTYGADGLLASITDPLGHTTASARDGAGRLTSLTRPDSQTVAYAYDQHDNVTGLTPPGRPAHTFAYTPIDLIASASAPGGATTTTTIYNGDRQETRRTRPGNDIVDFGYDVAGRLASLTIARGAYGLSYDTADRLTGQTAPGGLGLALSYNGGLPTGDVASGAVAGSVSRTFDTSFRRTGLGVNGVAAISQGYDNDDLLTSAGAMTITRSSQHGLATGSTLGTVTTTMSYSGFGEASAMSAAAGATTLYTTGYTRDKLGRLTQVVETVQGTTATYTYTYDTVGRLTEVKKDAVTIEQYGYDANNNRTSATVGGVSANATVDSQDRLLTYGTTTFVHTAAGDWASKTSGGQTTTYVYDALGNLVSATLPNGDQLAYLIDGANRRVGKRVNGTLVQGFLYDDQLRIVAELDGSNAVVSRFVYAEGVNVPAYLVKGGATYQVLTDHRGSVRLAVNTATGAVAQRLDYDSFGNVTQDTNPGFQPFGFAGGLYDRNTTLVRFGARDYDPASGRWTTKDALGFDGGDTNLYAYAGNDPINAVDPYGQHPIVFIVIAVVILILFYVALKRLAGPPDECGGGGGGSDDGGGGGGGDDQKKPWPKQQQFQPKNY